MQCSLYAHNKSVSKQQEGCDLHLKINEAMPVYIFESDVFASVALPEMQKFRAFQTRSPSIA